jgi:undecaprenyl-diphosphatase
MFDALIHLDQQLLLLINGAHCPAIDTLMWQFSAKFFWVPLYALLVFFFIRTRRKEVWITLLALALMIVCSDQISGLIKETVQRLRPSHTPALEGFIHLVNNYAGGDYGFVSSHAANCFAVAVFVSKFFKKRWVTIAIFCWAALVSYSRMYLGVHYPLDILGGAAVGVACGSAFVYLEKYFFNMRLAAKSTRNNS